VLICGDAVLTMNINSVRDLAMRRHTRGGPPYISTWNWAVAKQSVITLARLEPNVLACGHGKPMAGHTTAPEVRTFAARFAGTDGTPVDPTVTTR